MGRVSVCVIGAGGAGLCAARYLASQPDTFDFRVFERSDQVGGTWVYTERTGVDQHGQPIHSSMYKNLRTNVPKEIMSFLDFPFPEYAESYVHHTKVLKYLEDYAQHFNLHQYIQLHTTVSLVTPKKLEGSRTVWSVTVQNLETQEKTTQLYDSVMVCNGHYAVPNIPNILDIESFQGQAMHSHDYRQSDGMEGLRVVILGCASSGLDIGLELSTIAQQVYLSHNLSEPIQSTLPDNVKQVPAIKSACADGFILQDGTQIQADIILYCTGYAFSFPFLTPECGISVQGRRVKPLYKHLIHIEEPSMCFIGIPFIVLPFPIFCHQVQFYLKTLDGSLELPSKEEMYRDTEEDFEKRLAMQMPARYTHKLGALQWEYMQDLAKIANVDTFPDVIKEMYEMNSYRRKYHIMEHKNDIYKLSDGKWDKS